jgi:hypothetical protein
MANNTDLINTMLTTILIKPRYNQTKKTPIETTSETIASSNAIRLFEIPYEKIIIFLFFVLISLISVAIKYLIKYYKRFSTEPFSETRMRNWESDFQLSNINRVDSQGSLEDAFRNLNLQ